MTTHKRKGRPWPLIILMVAFLLPAAIAWTLFFSGWQPNSSDNRGQLVSPPHRLEGHFLNQAGMPVDPDVLRGKWTLFVVNRGPCESDCQERLVQTRQVRLALGQDADRTRRVLVLPEHAPGLNEQQKAAHRDLTVYRGADVVPAAGGLNADAPLQVSVMDTRGYRMMAYPEPFEPGDLLHDMEKLLRLSNIDLEHLHALSEDE